jgi:excisionase family DNA binding protein
MPTPSRPQQSTPALSRLAVNRRDAADAISVSVDTLDRLIGAGEIRCIRRGRLVLISSRELERWVESQQARHTL